MRTKTGIVISNKANKTIVVGIDSHKIHPKYQKRYRVTNKFYAHDPENKFQEGETVTIYETRPLSRLKRWTVIPPQESKSSS